MRTHTIKAIERDGAVFSEVTIKDFEPNGVVDFIGTCADVDLRTGAMKAPFAGSPNNAIQYAFKIADDQVSDFRVMPVGGVILGNTARRDLVVRYMVQENGIIQIAGFEADEILALPR